MIEVHNNCCCGISVQLKMPKFIVIRSFFISKDKEIGGMTFSWFRCMPVSISGTYS